MNSQKYEVYILHKPRIYTIPKSYGNGKKDSNKLIKCAHHTIFNVLMWDKPSQQKIRRISQLIPDQATDHIF